MSNKIAITKSNIDNFGGKVKVKTNDYPQVDTVEFCLHLAKTKAEEALLLLQNIEPSAQDLKDILAIAEDVESVATRAVHFSRKKLGVYDV